MREFLTIVVPLALPTVLYLLWMRLASGVVRWRAMPMLLLAGAGAGLLALVLFTVTVHFGEADPGVYVPPHVRDGRIVPAHVDPAGKP